VAAPTFYYDPSSPYAWMAEERIGELIPDADWQALYGFGLLKAAGRTPWVLTEERDSRLAEIAQRAERYGLPPIGWPGALPSRAVDLARAARVAGRHDLEQPFAIAVSRAIFTEGRDPSTPDELRGICRAVGLDADAVLAGLADQEVKDEVRATIDTALARGVTGVPAVVVDDEVFWGDDRLEEAAARSAGVPR
jgi:2-hydroxychromene-2-carboxylate isomerase